MENGELELTVKAREKRAATVNARIDELVAVARTRKDAALDPALTWLRPSESDWMTREEHEEMGVLQLELIRLQPTQAELRQRVARKRAARIAAMMVPA